MKSVLVFAAHPDDELLGLGGTVRRLADTGATVRAVIMAEGITSRAEKREEADLSVLKVLQTDAKNASRPPHCACGGRRFADGARHGGARSIKLRDRPLYLLE